MSDNDEDKSYYSTNGLGYTSVLKDIIFYWWNLQFFKRSLPRKTFRINFNFRVFNGIQHVSIFYCPTMVSGSLMLISNKIQLVRSIKLMLTIGMLDL